MPILLGVSEIQRASATLIPWFLIKILNGFIWRLVKSGCSKAGWHSGIVRSSELIKSVVSWCGLVQLFLCLYCFLPPPNNNWKWNPLMNERHIWAEEITWNSLGRVYGFDWLRLFPGIISFSRCLFSPMKCGRVLGGDVVHWYGDNRGEPKLHFHSPLTSLLTFSIRNSPACLPEERRKLRLCVE